ncbi:MAG: hypothetical protein GF334_08075 [Candidatus Altiarchaeales archaeon]|nr:hypothetical protein [Candidatus Altiarchaeales archaeon]
MQDKIKEWIENQGKATKVYGKYRYSTRALARKFTEETGHSVTFSETYQALKELMDKEK